MRAQRAGVGLAAAGTVALVAGWAGVMARQDAAAGIAIDGDDLAGVVTSVKGPEAGVWVIAETADLPTGFRKTVVTDDQGRYLVPDLPSASYAVWVRGYGLVDSPRVAARPGQRLNLTAVVAPDARAAAQYYPGNYWFSLLEIPGEDQFPGTGPDGNGIPENIRTQAQYVGTVKGGCSACHVTGPKATRELPEALGTFDSSLAAWERRTRSGQFGGGMGNSFRRLGPWAMRSFANWTDRIAGGAVPPQPPRPSGIERNFVFSSWDWASEFSFIHDIVATDKRNPTVNAYGPVWGADRHNAPDVSMVDPVKHTASRPVVVPIADKENTPFSTVQSVAEPSPYWGDQIIWSNRASTHNPMVDHKARLWLTATVRPRKNPSFCTDGALHPSAKLYPIEES
ncbi:MAG: carboxypeptidase regulatory-like domain-containing protein, partial [Chloroflexi bacterium]|nr:carboxypeptidase regulatory-like domain-containing protein [Chloroflexota bacterium]